MKMKLMHLKIRNFMGCKELDVDFEGKDLKVYGDNATGKTTLAHAFNWLLFDKNSYGKADFGIKPFDESGEVIHRLESSVEALFEIDGQPKQFKKVLREKWTRKRGSAEDTYSGNETDYYVNTVPKKKKEYTEEIAKVIDENVFRMITNPLYFNENLDWKERRKMLLDICGNITDEEVIASDDDLKPLLRLLQGRTVDELKSIVSSEMKSINKELGILPSRIAEAELAKPTPRDDVDVSELEALEQMRRDKVQAKADILNGAEIVRLKAQLDSKDAEIQKKNNEEWNKAALPEFQERIEVESRIRAMEGVRDAILTTTIPQIDLQIESNKRRKQQLSEEWDEVFKQTFLGSVCPTCHRELPPEQVDEKRRDFNFKKAKHLDSIEAELDSIKKRDTALHAERADAKNKADAFVSRVKEGQKRIDELSEFLVEESKKFYANRNVELAKLISERDRLLEAIKTYESNAEAMAREVDAAIAEIEAKIAPIKEFMAQQAMIERQDARIEELKESQKSLSMEYSDLERKLFLTEKFVRCKVAMLTEKINSHFRYASFRLFDVQVNGGISETCEVTYNGVPYRDLNTAGRLNIGLDIINTLTNHHGVFAPIFIDNMESITRPIRVDSQMIQLIVSEHDKVLRFEKE